MGMKDLHFTLFLKVKKLRDVFLYRVQELNQLFSRKILFQANGNGLKRTILYQSIFFTFFHAFMHNHNEVAIWQWPDKLQD